MHHGKRETNRVPGSQDPTDRLASSMFYLLHHRGSMGTARGVFWGRPPRDDRVILHEAL